MANYARYIKGETGPVIDYTPGGAVTAGQVVVVGDLVGVAKLDIAASVLGQLHLGGVYDFPKSTAGGSGQAAGTTMYWDSGNLVATPTATGNKMLGKQELVSVDADTTARIVLCPWALATFNPLTAGIADPGNAGAIPVGSSGHVDIVTAGAETRTLAVPTAAGVQLLIGMKTDGGDAVLTVADPHIDGTNNTVTFNDVGDAILLMATPSGSGFVWRLVVNVGCALSHV
jgi:predicted RecA/RadA family phage recombinase